MKRVFNKEKCIEDLMQLDPIVCELSKGWIEMCDGKEVINGIVTGNKGEEYLVSTDWTDVVEDEAKKIVDDAANKNAEYKTVFSRDLYIEDMDKCVPEVDHSKTGWAKDCDGAEVINEHVRGKKGTSYVIDDAWTKKVPVEEKKTPVTDNWLREDKIEEPKQKTKYFFSKKLYLATGEKYYPWVDDCDGAEVINGMAMGRSGIEYYMLPEWLKIVPAEEKPATKKIFSKYKCLKPNSKPYKWVEDCDGAEVIDGVAIGKSGKTYYVTDTWTVEVPVTADSYKIVIECNDNKTTAATLYKNGEKINEAIARCSDRDSFDLFKGATLALDRLLL